MNSKPETTFCIWDNKEIMCGFIKRLHCNATCNRKVIAFKKRIKEPKSVKEEWKLEYDIFRTYMFKFIKSEPLIHYSQWEILARDSHLPRQILEWIRNDVPLPKPKPNDKGVIDELLVEII